jgi:hypothetical protein
MIWDGPRHLKRVRDINGTSIITRAERRASWKKPDNVFEKRAECPINWDTDLVPW